MTILALASAKGSPGVTTLAHRLADTIARREHLRPPPDRRPVVLVEADPAGGDLAARRGLAGSPGLASLALTARRSLDAGTVLAHCQQLGGVQVLAGVAGCRQGAVVAPLLPRLAGLLRELGAVTLLDLGRIDQPAAGGAPSLPALADTVLLVTRTAAECVVHARSAVDALRSAAVEAELVLLGRPEYAPREIAAAVGAPVLGVVADAPLEALADPAAPLRGRRGELARSVDSLVTTLAPRLEPAGPAAARSRRDGESPPAERSAIVPLRPARVSVSLPAAPA